MQLIQNNPYRILGLLVGASARDQNRQITQLPKFIEAGQEPKVDYSFPVLGRINRTIDMVTGAASKLNLGNDKMAAALFWFYNGNSITDEPAFDSLKDSDKQSAVDIWKRLVSSGEVTQRNNSAFHNLSTLYLSNVVSVNTPSLEHGISLKLKFLESDYFQELKKSATDETYKTSKKELQLLFLNQLQSEIDKNGSNGINTFIEILNKQNFSAKEEFMKGFVQKPIGFVEKKTDEAKTKRKANKANAANIGAELFKQTSESMGQLKSILGATNIKFSSISDKVSDEILQCGIDYFSHYKDSNTDPGNAAMDLLKKAKGLAIGNIAKQRCKENTEGLQEWIDGASERAKLKQIETDLSELVKIIELFENRSDTIENARALINQSKPKLNNIKNTIGGSDDLYIKLSTRIAAIAQHNVIEEVNGSQQNLQMKILYDREGTLRNLKLVLKNGWEVTNLIGTLDMEYSFKTNYNQNRNSLKDLCTQLSVSTSNNTSFSSSSSNKPSSPPNKPNNSSNKSSGGCYIATMAYGNYDHPQVLILRQFRDNVLDKSNIGRWFIKSYYHYSPKLVEKLRNKKTVNSIIRKLLNQFIKFIK